MTCGLKDWRRIWYKIGMKILPAIDLKNGQCVRLRQGRMDDATVYASDPVEMALRWQSLGAEYLHIVDLDGAFAGKPAHTSVIARIAQAIAIPFEVGGGLRTDDDVREILDAGADRVILGTRAVADPEAIRRLAARHGVLEHAERVEHLHDRRLLAVL